MHTENLNLIQQGFIFEARDKADPSMAKLPENRTLLIANLTDKPATRPELVYELETMDAVFEHYKPDCKVEFTNESGESINETMRFQNMGDFTQKAHIGRSAFLRNLEQQQKDHLTIARRLQTNRALQKVLNDAEKKAAYIVALKALIEELESYT